MCRMKNIFITLSAIAFIYVLGACNHKAKTNSPLPVLDLQTGITEREVSVQDLGKVRYIHLQVSDSILLGDQMKLAASKNSLFFFNSSTGEVIGFNKEGKQISRFNRKGQGGEEYARIRQVIYDDEREEVFLLSWEKKQLLVYEPDGKYKRSLSLPDSIQPECIVSLDRNSLVLLDMNQAPFVKDGGELDTSQPGLPGDHPFMVMDKETGKDSKYLPVVSGDRYHSFLLTSKDSRPFLLLGRLNYLYPCNDGCILSEPAADTIFFLSPGQQVKPVLTRIPSAKEKEGRISLEVRAATSKIMLVKALFIKQDGLEKLPSQLYLYTIPENKFTGCRLKNTDWQGADITDQGIFDNNKLYYILYPFNLHEAMDKGLLSGELLEISKTLDEDDNPILMEVALD